jgi:positive regulator of sigma E activity
VEAGGWRSLVFVSSSSLFYFFPLLPLFLFSTLRRGRYQRISFVFSIVYSSF